MRTLLFDIDGTLLLTNSGGKGALDLAFIDEFGVTDAKTDIQYAGRTDRSILSELLKRNQLPDDAHHRDRLQQRYQGFLPEELKRRGGRVLPGVVPLLSELSQQNNLLCLVMTGNLQHTATLKLDHFGLSHYFRGVYGGDHDSHRDDLAKRTATEIASEHGEVATQDMIVIGDTPDDVRCGHAIGAKVLAVCTGSYDRETLEKESPMSVHDDLSDVQALLGLLAPVA
ncbi:MAG: HAD family hydrolase [Rubripirellula sp.]